MESDPPLSAAENEIKVRAEEFARSHKKEIVKKLTDLSKFGPEERPISVFMAGSPGAGKTEYSKRLIELLESDKRRKVIRIDSDELRDLLPGYNGNNSYLFQGAVTILSNGIHDAVLSQKQTFLLDGTFSKYEKAYENVSRSLTKGRTVFVFYVYQEPEVAWRSTQAREIVEGRNIPKSAFIRQFIGARDTVIKIRGDFDDTQVVVFLVKKNFQTQAVESVQQLQQKDASIDRSLGKLYTESDLEELL